MRVLAWAKGLPGPFPRVLGVGFAMILVASCGDNGSQAQQQAALPPPTVTVAKPVVREIVEDDEFVGRFRSEEHTSELQSLMRISYAVFCLKKTKHNITIKTKD